MKNFLVIGFRFGVYTSMIVNTIKECVELRATQKGFEEIIRVEEI